MNYPWFGSDLFRGLEAMPREYSPEFRVRALRLLDTMVEDPKFDAIKSVAGNLGVSQESVRRWRPPTRYPAARALPASHRSQGTLQSPFCQTCRGSPPVLRISTTSPGWENP